MEFGKTFNSKFLLFGEYGLMFGAMALAAPFSKFSGRLAFDTEGRYSQSTDEIRKLVQHLKSKTTEQDLHFPLDVNKLETDLAKGIYFDSNIPPQYGVGSSGVLVAALFSRYAFPSEFGNNLSHENLIDNFAAIDSYLQGK